MQHLVGVEECHTTADISYLDRTHHVIHNTPLAYERLNELTIPSLVFQSRGILSTCKTESRLPLLISSLMITHSRDSISTHAPMNCTKQGHCNWLSVCVWERERESESRHLHVLKHNVTSSWISPDEVHFIVESSEYLSFPFLRLPDSPDSHWYVSVGTMVHVKEFLCWTICIQHLLRHLIAHVHIAMVNVTNIVLYCTLIQL